MLKKFLKNTAGKMGYKITPLASPVRDSAHFLAYARSAGFHPATVIDVGVGYGTWPLYDTFPDAQFHLVEPLGEYEPVVGKIRKAVKAEWHQWAAGSAEGQLEIHLTKKDLEKTSFHQRTAMTSLEGEIETRIIPVKALDSLAPAINGPLLLKIDTEGHEMEALKGAKTLLGLADLVMLEISVGARFEGGYKMIDLTRMMDEAGFDLIDLTHISQKNNGPMRMIDGVFAKRGSLLGLPDS